LVNLVQQLKNKSPPVLCVSYYNKMSHIFILQMICGGMAVFPMV